MGFVKKDTQKLKNLSTEVDDIGSYSYGPIGAFNTYSAKNKLNSKNEGIGYRLPVKANQVFDSSEPNSTK